MGLEQTGVELVAEGESAFTGALESASDAVDGLGSTVETVQGGIDAFGSIVSGAFMAVGGVIVDTLLSAGSAVAGFFTDAFAGAMEAEQGMTRLQSVIESTGGAAGLTVDEATALADQFKGLAGGSDDAVIAIEEMALRLGSVSAEQMPTFIQSVLDLSAATGTDAVAAAQLLGTAYDDPVAAMGRLRKQGVLLTDDIEKQIKKMAESGDVAGATALLMSQLADVTGGSAAAQAQTLAGRWAILTETFADAGEGVAASALPALETLMDKVVTPAIPVITELGNAFSTFISTLLNSGIEEALFQFGEFDTVADVLSSFGINIYQLGSTIQGLVDGVMGNLPLAQATFSTVFESVQTSLSAVGDFVIGTFLPALSTIWQETGLQMPTAQSVFEGAMGAIATGASMAADFITNVFIPGLTTAVDWTVANWPTIQATIEGVLQAVSATVTTVVGAVTAFWAQNGDAIMATTTATWDAIQTGVTTAITVVSTTVQTVAAALAAFWQANGDTIMTTAITTWDAIQTGVTTAITVVSTTIQTVSDAIAAFWQAHGDSILTIAQATWDAIQSAVGAATAFLQSVLDTFVGVVEGLWATFGDSILLVAQNTWENIQTVIEAATTIIGDLIDAVAAAISGDWRTFGEELRNVWDTAWAAVLDILGNNIESTKAIIGNAITAIIGLFTNTDWGAVGSGIANGVAAGISAGVGAITSAAQSAAQAALDAAMGFLGIASPSKVAAELIGEPYTKGVAQGIEGRQMDVTRAVESVTNAMVEPAASPAAIASGSQTTINRSLALNFGGFNINNGMDVAQLRAFILQTVAADL